MQHNVVEHIEELAKKAGESLNSQAVLLERRAAQLRAEATLLVENELQKLKNSVAGTKSPWRVEVHGYSRQGSMGGRNLSATLEVLAASAEEADRLWSQSGRLIWGEVPQEGIRTTVKKV